MLCFSTHASKKQRTFNKPIKENYMNRSCKSGESRARDRKPNQHCGVNRQLAQLEMVNNV